MTTQIILAGFGGQGILFAGKLLAYAGMLKGKEVSWLPSYGPEMRGGTANCHVIVSDNPIASPIVQNPNVLIALNGPSLEKFIYTVAPGGTVIYDSSLISTEIERNDITVIPVAATKTAVDMNAHNLANMITLGKLSAVNDTVTLDEMKAALTRLVPAKKAALLDLNISVLDKGYSL